MKREWLIAYRRARGLSQEEVASALGMTQSCYGNYESGIRTPKPEKAKKIAKIFGFNWTKFYEETDIQNQEELTEKESG